MDFAPYQQAAPEHTRSPDTASPRTSLDRRPYSPAAYQKRPSQASPPPLLHPQPQRSWQTSAYQIPSPSNYQSPSNAAPRGNGGDGYFVNIGSGLSAEREGLNEFDTSLGIRLDYEACLAYLALPPLGAIVLLILERKSDFVRRVGPPSWITATYTTFGAPVCRFHAWQSALLFTAIFVLHLMFWWSTFFSWVFFLGDIALIAFLVSRAYRDADTLDRFEIPVIGQIASRFLDDE